MNEHIRKGNAAVENGNLGAAKTEYHLALADPDPLTQRIAKNRLKELFPEIRHASAPVMDLRLIASYGERVAPATTSRCCDARAVFVKSRDGGFIAKNCTRCKKSGYAREADFPVVECGGKQWQVLLIDKNYHYRCGECGITVMVADNVPNWSDLFPYDPLLAPGDPGWDATG